jgi:hypothetical protein
MTSVTTKLEATQPSTDGLLPVVTGFACISIRRSRSVMGGSLLLRWLTLANGYREHLAAARTPKGDAHDCTRSPLPDAGTE